MSIKSALQVLERYPVLGPLGTQRSPFDVAASLASQGEGFPALGGEVLTGDPERISAWREAITSEALPLALPTLSRQDIWGEWVSRLSTFLSVEPTDVIPAPLRYRQLVAAARGVLPAAALRLNLADVAPFDWSRFVLGTLHSGRQLGDPRWALVAGLAALRFPRRVLEAVAQAPIGRRQPSSDDRDTAMRFAAKGADDGRAACLVVYDPSNPEPFDPISDRPLLYVTSSELEEFDVGLDWLQGLDAFEAILREGHGDEQA